jgi:hypothetical protein
MLKREIIIALLTIGLIPLLAGCHPGTGAVVRRYTPQVGGTYHYRFEINRLHDPVEVAGEMHVRSKGRDGFELQFSGTLHKRDRLDQPAEEHQEARCSRR